MLFKINLFFLKGEKSNIKNIKFIVPLFCMFANINTIAMNLRRDTYKYNDSWKFANRSQIYSDSVSIYRTNSSNPKNKVVCINAGHGTPNGTKQYVPFFYTIHYQEWISKTRLYQFPYYHSG